MAARKAGPARRAGPAHATGTDFSHLDASGRVSMVDVTEKPRTARVARATGALAMSAATLKRILARGLEKGDLVAVAKIAAIQAAKRTHEWIPLCHPLTISHVDVEIDPDPELPGFRIDATVRATEATGAEMEALTAVTAAALALYDMAKAVDRSMTITDIRLEEKSGGRSGTYVRER